MDEEAARALRARFHGKLSPEEAMRELRALAEDKAHHALVRMEAATAMLDLRQGRSVQSTMARFRRAAGIDPAKPRRNDPW